MLITLHAGVNDPYPPTLITKKKDNSEAGLRIKKKPGIRVSHFLGKLSDQRRGTMAGCSKDSIMCYSTPAAPCASVLSTLSYG
jgi:hypothetical protein